MVKKSTKSKIMLYICNVDKAQNKLKNRNHDTDKKNKNKVYARQFGCT